MFKYFLLRNHKFCFSWLTLNKLFVHYIFRRHRHPFSQHSVWTGLTPWEGGGGDKKVNCKKPNLISLGFLVSETCHLNFDTSNTWMTSSQVHSLFRSWLDPMRTFTFQPVSKRPFTAQFWYQRNYKVYIIRRIGRTTEQGTNWSIVRERVKEVWRHCCAAVISQRHRYRHDWHVPQSCPVTVRDPPRLFCSLQSANNWLALVTNRVSASVIFLAVPRKPVSLKSRVLLDLHLQN